MNTQYKSFTFKAAVELISPPTWVASIGPCVVGGALALCCASPFFLNGTAFSGPLEPLATPLDLRSAVCWLCMLCCSVLMQAATNTLNDYQDFMSGLDTAETILDETDASLVYNQINPQTAKRFAYVLLACAAMLGITVAVLSSVILVLWGVIGAVTVFLYSAGPKPISSLPLGEIVSGVVMGGIITCATFYAMTLQFSAYVLAVAVIMVVGIGQINQTNNTCDIERDLPVGRKTLPGIIGERRSRILNGSLSIFNFLWLALILLWAGLYWGIIIAVVGFVICIPKINRLLKGPYNLINRREMMQTVVSYNRWLQVATALALITGGAFYVVM